MPHRLVTLAIVLFWLSMTGWLIQREIMPMMLADDSPTMQIDLTDEIGAPLVGWTVWRDGQRIGTGTSRIVGHDDRTFEFRSGFRFEELTIAGRVQIRQMENMYRVTENGKLLGISAKVALNVKHGKAIADLPDITIEIQGEVIDHKMQPRLLYNGAEQKLIDFGVIDVAHQGNIVNPMHLVNRLRGLRDGKSWRITMVDPLGGASNKFLGDLGKQGMAAPSLIAQVSSDILMWNQRPFACFRIDYFEPGKEVMARTWARKSDGLVLQQEASHLGMDLVLKRVSH